MSKKILSYLLIFIFLISCSGNKNEITEGIISYTIDYPNSKDNFFLYHVLPKELKTSFKDSKMEMKIKKATMENTLIIDSKNKNISAYFNYGDLLNCQLNDVEINSIIEKHPKYQITFTKEKDTLIGFNMKKAIAINPEKPKDKIEIWYTDEIKIKNSNWFNGFEKIPGVMLKYSIIQYGIKMDFVANKFENVTIPDSIVNMKRPGVKIPHAVYDKKINELFESFK